MKTEHYPTTASAILILASFACAQAQEAFPKKWQTSLPDFMTEVAAAAETSAKSETPSNLGALRTKLGSAMRQFESQPVQWEITFERIDQMDSLVHFKEAGREEITWYDRGDKPGSRGDEAVPRYEKGLVGFYGDDTMLHNAYPTKDLIHIRIYGDRRAFAAFAAKTAKTRMTIKGRVRKITGIPVMYDDEKTPKALIKGYLHRWILSVEVVSAVPTS